MTVITSSTLLFRRLSELRRRREALMTQQAQLRRKLPEWAIEPLCLAGMTAGEIDSMIAEMANVEQDVGLEAIEAEMEAIDRQLEQLEDQLLGTPARSYEDLEAVLSLAVARLRDMTVTDPASVYYDYGEARVLAMFERVLGDLGTLLDSRRLNAS